MIIMPVPNVYDFLSWNKNEGVFNAHSASVMATEAVKC